MQKNKNDKRLTTEPLVYGIHKKHIKHYFTEVWQVEIKKLKTTF